MLVRRRYVTNAKGRRLVQIDATDLILTVSIIVTLILGLRQQHNNRKATAHRATLDFIFNHEIHNRQWLSYLTDCHVTLKLNQEELQKLLKPETDTDRETLQKLYNVLNHFEMIAIGISEGSIHESTYRRWARKVVVTMWEKGRPFITLARKEVANDKFCAELEVLATRWANEAQLGK